MDMHANAKTGFWTNHLVNLDVCASIRKSVLAIMNAQVQRFVKLWEAINISALVFKVLRIKAQRENRDGFAFVTMHAMMLVSIIVHVTQFVIQSLMDIDVNVDGKPNLFVDLIVFKI
jgi:hypothetical protein